MEAHRKTNRAQASRAERARPAASVALLALVLAGSISSVGMTHAAATGEGDFETDRPCMQDLARADVGTLNCTANDVRISGVADVASPDPINQGKTIATPDGIVDENDIQFAEFCDAGAVNAGASCSNNPGICFAETDGSGNPIPAPELCGDRCAYPGDTTRFRATFIVELSAQARHDIGLYFATDGDPADQITQIRDGALGGQCSVGILPETGDFDRPDGSTGLFVDLDTTCNGGGCPQPEDTCGDINGANSPIYYDMIGPAAVPKYIEAVCTDTDNNGKLNLPNCTSWRQGGANEVCMTPEDAYPGAPSKCNCDPAFEVPINVPPAELKVKKTASPLSRPEPGGDFTFTIEITNTGVDPANDVVLASLTDDKYGNIALTGGMIKSTTCNLIGQTLKSGDKKTCSFTVTRSATNAGWDETDTVTASGADMHGNTVSGSDSAYVKVTDVRPKIEVTKTADNTMLNEPGGPVTYTVLVKNRSVASTDPVTISSLNDDKFGDVTAIQGSTCTVPQTLQPDDGKAGGADEYTCSFTRSITGQPGYSHTNKVTATGRDDDKKADGSPTDPVTASEAETVTIKDVASAGIKLTKTANPTSVTEPGGNVTFSFKIDNPSNVDAVTISSLSDTIYGDLTDSTALPGTTCSLPQTIAAKGSYSCSFTVYVATDLPTMTAETNVATASGVDDDGAPVSDSDDATVTFVDAMPTATLTKTATKALVTFRVEIQNGSSVEALIVSGLSDTPYGDVTKTSADPDSGIQRTDCSVPWTISTGGKESCTFDAWVTTSPHVDTVTATAGDNEGNIISPKPSDSATVTLQ
ncbi:MAG: hypothetical protein JSW21_01505 [Gammaproteobacteria bacterium]|nr:MAG: hypothetical protein JSW21_01505 [Gammaproteobacteria bacterium]